MANNGNGNGLGHRPANWDTHPRRCTARKSTTGERCGHWAIRGGTVCKYHGGAAPQVQRAITARRMKDLYGPMLAGLTRCLESNDLDAIAKACALISRHYLADTEAGRLSPDSEFHSNEWMEYLDTDELQEVAVILHESQRAVESYKELAQGRMDAKLEYRSGLGFVTQKERIAASLPDIEVLVPGTAGGE